MTDNNSLSTSLRELADAIRINETRGVTQFTVAIEMADMLDEAAGRLVEAETIKESLIVEMQCEWDAHKT